MPGRPVARRGLRPGVVIDRALVVVLLVGEFGLREHVLVVDDEQQIVEGLQMQASRCSAARRRISPPSASSGSRTSTTEKPLEKIWPI